MNLLDLLVKISVDDQASAKVATIGTGFRGAMSTMGKVAAAGAVAVGTAMVAVSSAALNAYSQYEQLVGGVDTLFKTSSSTVQRYAEQAYQTAGISANRYMEISTSFSAALINSLGGDTAAAAEMANTAIMDMSDNANRMGTSLDVVQEAYMSLSRGNYAMLDSLKLGYGGTKSELERLLSDAEQIAASQGMVRDFSVDSYADIVEAIHLVQGEMGITGTTAEEAAHTIEGSVNMAKASWENFLAGLGNEDADMSALTDQLVSSIGTAMDNVIPRLGYIMGTLISTMVSYGPQMVSALADMFSSAVSAASTSFVNAMSALGSNIGTLEGLSTALSSGLVGAIQSATAQIPAAMSVIVPNLLAVLTSVVTTIFNSLPGILVAGLDLVITAITSFVQQIAAQLPVVLPVLLQSLITNLNNLIMMVLINLPMYLGQVVQAAMQLFQGIADAIPLIIPVVVQGITTLVHNVLTYLPSFLGNLISAAGTLFRGIVTGIAQIVPSVLSGIGSLLQNIWNEITNFDLVGAGVDLIQGFIDGIGSMAGAVVDAIGSAVGGAIDGALGLLGIASPSKVFREIGQFTMQGLSLGVDDYAEEPAASVDSAIRSMVSSVGDQRTGVGMGHGAASEDVVSAIDALHADLGRIIERYAPAATPREFRSMVNSVVRV